MKTWAKGYKGSPWGPNAPSLEEEGRRFLIWSRSRGDTEAAKEAGMKRSSWIVWRIRRGLPTRWNRDSDFLAAWRKASSDPQAAQMVGVEAQIFSRWRKNHDLPPCRGNPLVRRAIGKPLPAFPAVREEQCSACGRKTAFYPWQRVTRTCGRVECLLERRRAGGRARSKLIRKGL